jgi:hypothetical protein
MSEPIPSGYLPPAAAFQPPMSWQGPDPNDPLVNPAYAGIGGWFGRITAMFQRSWKSMTAVFAITQLLPTVVLSVLGVLAAAIVLRPWQEAMLEASVSGEQPEYDFDPALVLGFAGAAVVLVLLLIVLQTAGYAAATYVVTREAAGASVPLGEALRYGFRRCPGLFGWLFVTGLLVLAGALACILPAFYVYAATALVGPIYLFERRSPIGRSFTIFNNNLGRILGRLAMILLIVIGGSIAVSTVENIMTFAVNSSGAADAALVGSAVIAGLGAVLGLPFTMFQFVGVLLTYTEQRGYEGPAATGALAAEL